MPTIRVHFAWAAAAMLSAATAQAARYPMAGIEPLSSRSPLFLEPEPVNDFETVTITIY